MQPWTTPILHDRVVVTGGGSGIGQGVALALADVGATVYVLGRRESALAATQALADGASGTIVPVVCDVRKPEAVDAAFSRIEADGGSAPGLVHSAANVDYTPGSKMTSGGFATVVDSVLFGAFNTVQRWAAPLIEAATPGVAAIVTSCIASRGTPGAAHSSAGKAGIEAMMKTLAREWGPIGLRLNAIGPGFFPNERTAPLLGDREASAPIRELIALGRLGEPAEIVGPIMFLLSAAASYITGEVLVTDGGFRLTPLVLPTWRFQSTAGTAD